MFSAFFIGIIEEEVRRAELHGNIYFGENILRDAIKKPVTDRRLISKIICL